MESHNQYGTRSAQDGPGANRYSHMSAISPRTPEYPQQQYPQSYPGQGENAPEYAGHAPAGSGHDAPEVVQNPYHDIKPSPLSPEHTLYPYSATDASNWEHPDDTNKVVMPNGIPVEAGKEMYPNSWQQQQQISGNTQHYAAPPPGADGVKPKNRRRLFIIIGIVAAVVIAIVVGVTAGVLVSRKNSS
jgi:hypothetical protein